MPLSDTILADQDKESVDSFSDRDPRWFYWRRVHLRYVAFGTTGLTIAISVILAACGILGLVFHSSLKASAYRVWFIGQLKLWLYDEFDYLYLLAMLGYMALNALHVLLLLRVIAGVDKTVSSHLWPELVLLVLIVGSVLCVFVCLCVIWLTHQTWHWLLQLTCICVGSYFAGYLAVLTSTFRYVRAKEYHVWLQCCREEAEAEARRAVKFFGVPNTR